MPTWLFWKIVEATQRDRVRGMIEIYQASGASGMGFSPESSKDLVRSWQQMLDQHKQRKAKRPMTRDERRAVWLS